MTTEERLDRIFAYIQNDMHIRDETVANLRTVFMERFNVIDSVAQESCMHTLEVTYKLDTQPTQAQ